MVEFIPKWNYLIGNNDGFIGTGNTPRSNSLRRHQARSRTGFMPILRVQLLKNLLSLNWFCMYILKWLENASLTHVCVYLKLICGLPFM